MLAYKRDIKKQYHNEMLVLDHVEYDIIEIIPSAELTFTCYSCKITNASAVIIQRKKNNSYCCYSGEILLGKEYISCGTCYHRLNGRLCKKCKIMDKNGRYCRYCGNKKTKVLEKDSEEIN